MILLTNITDDPKQNFVLTGENGEIIPFYLYFCPRQIGWFFNISYGDFTVNGLRLCVGPNALFQWKNIIPFGLCCTSTDGQDPFYLDDFTTGRVSLYLLNQADVIAFDTAA